jgi:hypothetical protein
MRTKEKTKMKKSISLLIFLLFISAALNAQTADEIQTLLETPVVSYEQAVCFVLEAADVTGYDKTSGQEAAHTAAQNAMNLAIEKKWLPKKAAAQDAITLERLSLLIMKAFKLKGGPMYTWSNSAHYSYREMVFQDFIRGRTDPQMKVSGETLLYIVSRVLFLIEKNPWEIPEQPKGIPEQSEETHADQPEDEQ